MRLTSSAAILLAVTLTLAPITPTLAQPVETTEDPVCHRVGSVPVARPCETWSARFNGPGDWYDAPDVLVTSPDGSLVHTVGHAVGDGTARDVTTITYDAATGEEVWEHTYDAAGAYDVPSDTVVGEDGTIYVAAASANAHGDEDYLVIALDGATGQELWTTRYDGPATDSDALAFHDLAWATVLSPDEQRLFVTGTVRQPDGTQHAGTLALETGDGSVDWVANLDAGEDGFGIAITVSPDGARVYVAAEADLDQALAAYDAGTGALLWTTTLDDEPGRKPVDAVLATPDGSSVLLVGARQNAAQSEGLRFRISLHDADTGEVTWLSEGPPGTPSDAVLSHDGDTLYVSGATTSTDDGAIVVDAAVLAFDVATGERLWTTVYHGPYEVGTAGNIALDPAGDRVYTGVVSASLALRDIDAVTVGLDTETGELAWGVRYAGKNVNYNHGLPQDQGPVVTVGPHGAVFTSLASDNLSGTWDMVTLRYDVS